MMTVDYSTLAHIERTPEGTSLRFVRHFDRPRDAVWQALTEPAQLAQWLDKAHVDLRVGGVFEIRFDDGTMSGIITDLVENQLLAYSWHENEFGRSHVRWELTDAAGGTDLLLTHTRLEADHASGFAAGWHHHLERLEALVAGESAAWASDRFEELHEVYKQGT